VISNYAAASQIGTAPGAGAGSHISDDERRSILEEEQRQLDQMKVTLIIYVACLVLFTSVICPYHSSTLVPQL